MLVLTNFADMCLRIVLMNIQSSQVKRARSLHLTALFLLSCGPQWSGEASSWDVTASMAQHDGAVGAAHAATLLILPRLSGLCLALRGGRTPTGGLWRDMPAPRPAGASLGSQKKIAAPIKMGSHGFVVQRTPVDLSVLLARSLCSFARMCARPPFTLHAATRHMGF